ncbi:hypothetical protein WAE58_24795 [Pedobacter panaciterrae]|uniref:DUF115 domain-containing protein n=1 Tax=Pedobacter panaciterrae TaxID=363849 RepID=A0ABU8NVK2_9SPHI
MNKLKEFIQLLKRYVLIKELLPYHRKGFNRVFKFVMVRDYKTALLMLNETLKSIIAIKGSVKDGYNYLNTKSISDNKKSDTLFILGSGPSINEITDEEWSYIKKNESWGFNFWFCHDFIPSAYIIQSVYRRSDDKQKAFADSLDQLMTDMLTDKKERYTKVNFFARGDGVNNQKFFNSKIGTFIKNNFRENIFLMPECPISSKNKVNPYLFMQVLNKNGFLTSTKEVLPIPKFGSTIGELIPLALILGFKKIVLCGIDMNDGAHFYDKEINYEKYPMLRTLSELNNNREKHEHMDSSTRLYTVKDIVIEQNRFATENMGAKIYTFKTSSSLYPDISKFEY